MKLMVEALYVLLGMKYISDLKFLHCIFYVCTSELFRRLLKILRQNIQNTSTIHKVKIFIWIKLKLHYETLKPIWIFIFVREYRKVAECWFFLYSDNVFYFFFHRHTIAQAKQMFRFTSSREENVINGRRTNARVNSSSRNVYQLQKKDLSSKLLFERGHLLAHQQPSNESTTSTKRSEDTISITDSNLWSISNFFTFFSNIQR